MTPIAEYLKNIELALKQGNATEHTHRPALKALIEALGTGFLATNEPKHIACGAPDFVVSKDMPIGSLVLGYIEAKDVGKNLNAVEKTVQLKRYLGSLENLILTDYLEFRWFVDGKLRRTVKLAEIDASSKLRKVNNGSEAVKGLISDFLAHTPQQISSPHELAQRMARLTHLIRDVIVLAFENEQASPLLKGWRDAFARVLVTDLDQPEKVGEFADMFAQTLAYGLFSARIMDNTPGFTRQEAQKLIPRTNPFLRSFFYQISGPDLDDEPFASFVNDLVALLSHTDMVAVLADFGKRNRQEDPVVHFYETFLAAYDPKMRDTRGVYYTPSPVVSFIVRSVDQLLKTRFNCSGGLANTDTTNIPNRNPGITQKGKSKEMRKTVDTHRVLVLDPATGTATFLYAVIDQIRQQFMEQGNAGMWPGYVRQHLLPRLFGFELLMAPYAVAHFKLALQLAGVDLPEVQRPQWAYDFSNDERIRIYLTNALEGPHEHTGLPLFTQFLATETEAANEIKQDLPIMVVLGNPPYSNFGGMNKGPWITELMKDWKPQGERKWNPDDFMKFMRWAQWRIERTKAGILAFITNNTYIDGITHRRMRKSLMETFQEIFILNLHGNARRKLSIPDGAKDQNVFDIQPGVAISLFIKNSNSRKEPKIWYADLFGTRESKYSYLLENDVTYGVEWQKITPSPRYFFFCPKNYNLSAEYENFFSLTKIFPKYVSGIQTGRDNFVSRISNTEFNKWIETLVNHHITDEEIAEKEKLPSWKGFDLNMVRQKLRNETEFNNIRTNWFYRPFDVRPIIFDPSCIKRTRGEIMSQLREKNIALITVRKLASEDFHHAFVTTFMGDGNAISSHTREYNYYYPLFIATANNVQKDLFNNDEFIPNISRDFISSVETKLGLLFVNTIETDMVTNFGPFDIFHYVYAVINSPTYRELYSEFLKSDFPKIPLTSSLELFHTLCNYGKELTELHLLSSPALDKPVTRYPVTGNNRVDRGYPRFEEKEQRVLINREQYFEGVSQEIWEFQIGSFQVCEKWLKDRSESLLSYNDLTHYQKMIVALKETIRLMEEIDKAIPEWPIR